MTDLARAFAAASPRGRPVATPWPSLLIHGAVAGLWVLLFARAFFLDGLFAWSAGIVYVGYDTLLLIFVFSQTLALLRPTRAAAGTGARPSVAVIVAARNEASVLPVTLAALMAQTDRPELIVLADDGSTDGTADLLASRYGLAPGAGGVAERDGVRWLRLPPAGKAAALNAALQQVEATVVLTVDADTLLAPDAVGAMRDAFAADPALVAATGIMTPVCADSASGKLFQWFQTYEYMRNFLSRYAWMRMDSLLLISGAFAGFRREAVLAVGGFDTDCLVEDYELIHRLRRHGADHGLGWHTTVLGSARARTEAPSTLPAFLRQRRRWFGGFLQTQYWYRDMCGARRYGRLGTMMLPVKALDTMQPIYGLLAFALLLLWLVGGHVHIALPVLAVILAKIVFDLAFHLWSLFLYQRWVGERTAPHILRAALAALAEPFTFQILRHLGAALGWVAFLAGQRGWGVQRRFGLAPRAGE